MVLFTNKAYKSLVVYGLWTWFTTTLCKNVIVDYFFPFPFVIIMLQMMTVLMFIEILRTFGVIKVSPYSFTKCKALLVPTALLTYASWINLAAYEGFAIPNFDTLHRFMPVFVMLLGMYYNRNQRLDRRTMALVALVSVAGSAAVHMEPGMDNQSFWYGVFCFCIQGFAYIKLEQLSQTYTPLELLYTYSVNSLTYCLIADLTKVTQDEVRDVYVYIMTSSTPFFIFLFLLLLATGPIALYYTFVCIAHTDALTTVMAGNVRAAFQILLAYFFSLHLFYDVQYGFSNWVGLACSTAATVYFIRQRHSGQDIYGTLKTALK